MEISKAVGKRIKDARKQAGLTQKQIGEMLGMVQSAYVKYELGIIQLDYEKLIKICTILDVSADYLLGLKQY